MSEMEANELMPMNYLKIFFRRKEIIVVPTFIGLVIGICAGIVLPKKYVSSTILLVEEGKTDNPLFEKLAVATTVKQRLETIRESMLGWNSLVTLVKRVEMDKDVKTPQEFERLILGIRKNISIKLRSNNIIDLSYVGDMPEQTQSIVKNITDIFIERNLEIQNENTTDAVSFIEEQLKVYRGKIKSSEIAKLKDDLGVLLVDSTEQHPTVKQLREQIAAKEEELRKENLEYTENVNVEIKTDNPVIQEIKKSLDSIEQGGTVTSDAAGNDIYKVMLIDKLDMVIARDENVNTKIYNMLLERLETAKITQRLQSSKEGTRYTVLDPPRVPFKPAKPNKLFVAFIGLISGLGLGVALVLAIEFLDKSFLDVEDATKFFGMPLLGAISRITTEANIKNEKEKAVWLYSLTTVVGVVAIILTKAMANFLHLN